VSSPAAADPVAESGYGDLVMAVGLTGILVALIIPLPPLALDVLLTLNFSYVLLLLMVALGVRTPLELSAFPSFLLVGTLFRLALNVASTRLILLNGYAGEVIESFGEFVTGGEVVVGLVIFFILVVIQFVVITKGAERISEVAARFTLDAMPGKQMSIDADLSAGLIGAEEAKRRRQGIVREADFFGAMDGASKYVRGDAIAGIIIVFVNLLGGMVIGLTKGMSIVGAIQTYSVLTVGDGLVTQIPAIIMSTAAGVLITNPGSEMPLNKEFGIQIFSNRRAVGIAAGIIFCFMLMPGLPSVPFFVLGAGLTGIYFLTGQREKARSKQAAARELERPGSQETEAEAIESLLEPDRIAIEVGYGLIQLIDPQKGGTLLERIRSLRKKFARETGIIVPKIRIVDNIQMDANGYRMRLSGHTVAEGVVYPGRLMAMKPGGKPEGLQGREAAEPSFGLPVVWIEERQRESA